MTTSTTGVARRIAWTAGGAFATFYILYTAAPILFAHSTPGSGVRTAVMMLVVVAIQPLLLLRGSWTQHRRATVLTAVTAMGIGMSVLPVGDHWPATLLLAIGFGIFVVTSTAWVKENAPPGVLGRALGIYGFGSAVGGAIGAPVGVFLAERFGLPGVAVGGTAAALAALLPMLRIRPANNTPDPCDRHTVARPREQNVLTAAACTGTVLILLAHLLAVTVYAFVLTGLAGSGQGTGTWLVVWATLALQAALAAGRWVGGTVTDRTSPIHTGLSGSFLLFLGSTVFVLSTSPCLVVISGALVGLASGTCQTVALTVLMRRARTGSDTTRVSAAWNICFDIGLGLVALVTGARLT